jgi:hypothetical protein
LQNVHGPCCCWRHHDAQGRVLSLQQKQGMQAAFDLCLDMPKAMALCRILLHNWQTLPLSDSIMHNAYCAMWHVHLQPALTSRWFA